VERDKEKDGVAHQDGKRPRKAALFGGARLTIETGPDFGSPALSMKMALLGSGTIENALANENRLAGRRP
jgi:hypothetical protein